MDWHAKERTRSVWDYIFSTREKFLNPKYDPEVDDHIQGKERIILPDKDSVRWWAEVFGRSDAELNGPILAPSSRPAEYVASPRPSVNITPPVVAGIETADQSFGETSKFSAPPATTRAVAQSQETISSGLARLGIGRGGSSSSRAGSPRTSTSREEMEVEMQ